MPADPVLVLAWLVLAHLVADFVLQTNGVVADKAAPGRRAIRGLAIHGLGVAGCLVPFVAVFGAPGLWVLLAVTGTHLAIDRLKIVATRRAEARAIAGAHRRHQPDTASGVTLGPAWTPIPAGLFALDQLAHLLILGGVWALWLADATPLATFADGLDALLGGRDPADVHAVTLITVVLVSLAIVNVRAGALFVATLVSPREARTGAERAETPAAAIAPVRPPGWRLRLGPLEASAEPLAPSWATPAPPDAARHAPPARVGATIGVLERLLIVTFVLTGAQAAIGFVVAAKTIARFKQLDDRDFAEYYLLGTLASVGVALASGLLAAAALDAAGLRG